MHTNKINLDPRTKIVIVLIISIFMMSGRIKGDVIYPRMVMVFIPFILLVFERRIKAGLIYALLLAAGTFAEAWLIYSTAGIINIIITMLSGVATRFLPGVVMGYYLLATTTVSQFIASMERISVPAFITIPLSVMFRFFPTIKEEAGYINDAMKMRGIGAKSFFNNPVTLLEYKFVPLLISIVKIGEDLSVSALTRGLGGPGRRTNICNIGFSMWDVIFFIVVVSAAIFYIIL